jgi:hypothetical protein
MKKLIGLIFLTALLGVAYITYDLRQKDELNVNSFQSELSKHWDTAKQQSSKLASMSKEQFNKLKIKWDEQYAKLDWDKIKTTLKIGDKDLEEYKKFMKWAHTDDAGQNSEPKIEATKTSQQTVQSDEPSRSKPVEMVQERADGKALILLREAKALNRKAIPNQPGYQKNLKKAVQAYEAAAEEYTKLLNDPVISKTQKASYEKILSQINQQIYWGKKFTSI